MELFDLHLEHESSVVRSQTEAMINKIRSL